MQIQMQIHEYVEAHSGEIIQTLKNLIRIPSVRGEAKSGAPFGKANKDILEYAERLYSENGFETELDRDGGYLLSYYGVGRKALGLFAHADVVPVADDWTLTQPFEPIEKDGYIVGRGALDDKSAVVISLYCMKMLKELGIPFGSRLVCFTGANEESGMQDVKSYVSRHTPPDFSLIADTAFPLYRGNKGALNFEATAKRRLNSIKKIRASNAKSAILGYITVSLDYNEKLYNSLYERSTERISVVQKQDEILISSKGISKHTALPEGSLNAAYPLMKILSECEELCEYDRKQMSFLSDILSHYYGEVLEIENEDPEFGKLTCTNDIFKLEDGKLKLHFNIRFGSYVDPHVLKEKLHSEFEKNGWDIEIDGESAAHITPKDDPMLVACLDAYKKFSGNSAASMYVNAGGTYAVYLPRAAEIGTTLKWGTPSDLPKGHGGAHQPDECLNIQGFLDALELTVLMLLECDRNG